MKTEVANASILAAILKALEIVDVTTPQARAFDEHYCEKLGLLPGP